MKKNRDIINNITYEWFSEKTTLIVRHELM